MKSLRLWCFALLAVFAVSGCAKVVDPMDKVVLDGSPEQYSQIRLALIQGSGFESATASLASRAIWAPNAAITGERLKADIAKIFASRFDSVGWLASQQDAKKAGVDLTAVISVNVIVGSMSWTKVQSDISVDFKTTEGDSVAKLEASGAGSVPYPAQVIINNIINIAYTDLTTKMDAGLAQVTRYAALVKRMQQVAISATGQIDPINTYHRVISPDAPLRRAPMQDATELTSYPVGSIVHVIGKFDEEWLQVAKNGKPYGWMHQSATREEGAIGGGSSAAGTGIGKKPTIYIAYPKGGEQVAEDSIEFIGYVSSDNRTDRIEVLVNNRRIPVTRLWSEFRVDPEGLRGYPIRWRVPLNQGANKINVNVLDQEGFLVNHAVNVERIQITETSVAATAPKVEGLPARLDNIDIASREADVTADNFMNVLGSWVKDTAKSDYNKGNAMFDDGRYARAAYYYRKSIKTDPLGDAYFNLGVAEKAQGKDAEATEAFARACGLQVAQGCQQAEG